MLVCSDAAAVPGKADLQGAVPHTQDPRPGLSARRLAGEGRAAGRGVDEDVAEQQAVEAAKHVHHAAGRQRQDVTLQQVGTRSAGSEDTTPPLTECVCVCVCPVQGQVVLVTADHWGKYSC